jgi:hypothetical protein
MASSLGFCEIGNDNIIVSDDSKRTIKKGYTFTSPSYYSAVKQKNNDFLLYSYSFNYPGIWNSIPRIVSERYVKSLASDGNIIDIEGAWFG